MRKVLLQKAWTFIELDIQAKTTSKNETLPEKPVLLSACCSLFRPSRPTPLLNHSQEPVRFNQLTRTSEVTIVYSAQTAALLRGQQSFRRKEKREGMQLVKN